MEESLVCEEFCAHEHILAHFADKRLKEETALSLTELFKTLSEPTRVKILYYLLQEPLCVCDLSVLVGASQSAISNQLRILRNSKIVSGQKDGKQVIYSIRDEGISELLDLGLDCLTV